MSIMRSFPTGINGIANIWFNFDQFSKTLKSTAFLGEKCVPPKLKLRIYLAGLLATYTSLQNALGTSGAGGVLHRGYLEYHIAGETVCCSRRLGKQPELTQTFTNLRFRVSERLSSG